jgi:hypothetical protein
MDSRDAERQPLPGDVQARMMKPVATLAMLLMALMPAAAAPIPAVKSAQCPPGVHAILSRTSGSRPEAYALPKRIDAEGQQLLPRSQTNRDRASRSLSRRSGPESTVRA